MASISTIKAVSRLKELHLKVISPTLLSKVLNVENRHTIYKILERLEKYKLVEKLIKGKYILSDLQMSDFEKANIILSPSYISLESALSHYGILSQFTYSITSVTTQKSKKYKIKTKEYDYTKIKKAIFSDFIKKDNFLIATPEKALIDLIYLTSKKLRSINLSDLDLSIINWKTFDKIKMRINYKPFQNYIMTHNLHDQ